MFKVNQLNILVMFLVLLSANTSNGSGLERSPEDLARYLHVKVNNHSVNEFRLEDVIVTQGNLAEDGMPNIGTVIPSGRKAEFLFKQSLVYGPQATIMITGSMGRFTLKVNQNFSGTEAGDITDARWVYKTFIDPDRVREGAAASILRGSFASSCGRVVFDLIE
jgi:hypothetical protein